MYRQDIVTEAIRDRRELLTRAKQLGRIMPIDLAAEVADQVIMLEANIQHHLNFLRNELLEIEKLMDAEVGDWFELAEQKSDLEYRIFITENEMNYE